MAAAAASSVIDSHGNGRGRAQALQSLGHLERCTGNLERAKALHYEALELYRQIGDEPGTAASLEALGGLAAIAGQHAHAARLFGAAGKLRDVHGYARGRQDARRHQDDLESILESLSAEELELHLREGAGLPMRDVLAQVSKGRGRRDRPASGWSSLTGAERQVAALVAEGLTNREVAERLFITPGTVKNHLSHIFSKLGISGRRVLAREVRERGN